MSNLRMTPEEWRRLQSHGNVARPVFGQKPTPAPRPRVQKSRDELPENQVAGQILGALRAKGWVVTRQQSGAYVGISQLMRATDHGQVITRANLFERCHPTHIGEKGQCDWIARRPIAGQPGTEHQFEIEFKAPGKSPSPEQSTYMRNRKLTGFVAVWFDNYDAFLSWYKATWESR